MEIMDKGYMIIPVILFVGGILVSLSLGGMGVDILANDQKKGK
ncbi:MULTISPECIES: hypothetical protein [Ferrovum]|jgi:hypothetical protein|uniref:Uncharacterized protein n=1 Tax=Ferrovum myxofaciens TaxID=416213 RepID=A0A149VZ75_9PROT|nr:MULTISPECIES: hypothetical protein [Ferrovum]KXW58525.1 hypothetical protein FEMY_09240 [Ferrovum myxofaciens]